MDLEVKYRQGIATAVSISEFTTDRLSRDIRSMNFELYLVMFVHAEISISIFPAVFSFRRVKTKTYVTYRVGPSESTLLSYT